MENKLLEKLQAYLLLNYPDLLQRLEKNHDVRQFLKDKVALVRPLIDDLQDAHQPSHVIEELCFRELTVGLGPSRFNYIQGVLQSEFPAEFNGFKEAGVLTYESLNLVAACRQVFDDFDYSEQNQENRHLRYAIISVVHDYLV